MAVLAVGEVAASSETAAIRTLLIDNYDSYTYNLHQLIAEVNGGKLRLALCFEICVFSKG